MAAGLVVVSEAWAPHYVVWAQVLRKAVGFALRVCDASFELSCGFFKFVLHLFFLLNAIALLSECDMLLQKHLCFRQHDAFVSMMFLPKAYGILALG